MILSRETFTIVKQSKTKSPLEDESFQFMSLPSTVQSFQIFSSLIACQLKGKVSKLLSYCLSHAAHQGRSLSRFQSLALSDQEYYSPWVGCWSIADYLPCFWLVPIYSQVERSNRSKTTCPGLQTNVPVMGIEPITHESIMSPLDHVVHACELQDVTFLTFSGDSKDNSILFRGITPPNDRGNG